MHRSVMVVRGVALALAALLLAACGGVGDEGPVLLDTRAIWTGTLRYADGGTEPCLALGSAGGDTRLVPWKDGMPLRGDEAYLLDFSTNDGRLGGNALFFDWSGRIGPSGEVSGSLTPRAGATGELDAGLADGFDLLFDAVATDRVPSAAELAGSWAGDDGAGRWFTIDVDDHGGFSAASARGESMTGRFVVLDPSSNVRLVEGDAEVGSGLLPFRGLAAIVDGVVPGDTLLLLLTQTVPSGVPLFPFTSASRVYWGRR